MAINFIIFPPNYFLKSSHGHNFLLDGNIPGQEPRNIKIRTLSVLKLLKFENEKSFLAPDMYILFCPMDMKLRKQSYLWIGELNFKIRVLSFLKLLKYERGEWSYFCHFWPLSQDMDILFCPLDIELRKWPYLRIGATKH